MYIRTNEWLGEPQPTCAAADPNLESLATSLKWFNKETAKTYSDPKRLKNLGSLVTDDADRISQRLGDYMDGGCCEPELKALESQVRALPWIFQRTRGTKVVRVEVYRNIVRAHANLINAIRQAQRTATSHTICAPAPTPAPGGSGAHPDS